jgi:hypothetical protein
MDLKKTTERLDLNKTFNNSVRALPITTLCFVRNMNEARVLWLGWFALDGLLALALAFALFGCAFGFCRVVCLDRVVCSCWGVWAFGFYRVISVFSI